MSYYYKYNFVSSEPTFAIVREEFKSYFDTGAIDDLMFPTYLKKCLDKLGRGNYAIKEDTLYIEDFIARLPDNFYAVREAWLCTQVNGKPYRGANSFYSQAASTETIQISPTVSGYRACANVDCTNSTCGGECMPELIQAVYKTNNQVNMSYTKEYLLKPGNISINKNCELGCANFGSDAADSFDIRDNKFVTNFREGIVHLVFYATDYDESGSQLIPDNYRIKEYIEAFIKFKLIEQLINQVNDETSNQLERKLSYYKGLSDEAYILAETEIKKQDAYAKFRRIKQNLNRLNMYELPNRVVRYGWRRNN